MKTFRGCSFVALYSQDVSGHGTSVTHVFHIHLLLRWPSVCLGSWRSSGTTCGAWLVCFLLVGWSSWITHSMKTKEESGYIEFLVEHDIIDIHLYTHMYIIYAYDIYICFCIELYRYRCSRIDFGWFSCDNPLQTTVLLSKSWRLVKQVK